MERFSRSGVTLKTRMEMTSNSAIKHAVEAGLGLASCPSTRWNWNSRPVGW